MFNKVLSSIGIGAAKVDTRLETAEIRPGDTLHGEVHIKGGKVDQEVAKIDMALYTTYEREGSKGRETVTYQLCAYDVSDGFTVRAGEEKVIPFAIDTPYFTPMTLGRQAVYLATSLDVARALDPRDKDPITVLPDPLVAAFLTQADRLDLLHTRDSGRCKFYPSDDVPFVQEFELKPQGGPFQGRLDELELFFDVYHEGVEVFATIDRSARGLSGVYDEAMDLDERFERFEIPREDGVHPQELANFLNHVLGDR